MLYSCFISMSIFHKTFVLETMMRCFTVSLLPLGLHSHDYSSIKNASFCGASSQNQTSPREGPLPLHLGTESPPFQANCIPPAIKWSLTLIYGSLWYNPVNHHLVREDLSSNDSLLSHLDKLLPRSQNLEFSTIPVTIHDGINRGRYFANNK